MGNEEIVKTSTQEQAKKDRLTFSFSWIAIVVRGIVGTCISLFVFTQANRIEDEDTMARFTLLSEYVTFVQQTRIVNSITFIESSAKLYEFFPTIDHKQFLSYLETFRAQRRFLDFIAWIPKDDVLTDFDEERRAMIIEARKTGKVVTSIPLPSNEKEATNAAYLDVAVPIMRDNNLIGTVIERVNLKTLLSIAIPKDNIHSLNIAIYDGTEIGRSRLVYTYYSDPSSSKTAPMTLENIDNDTFSLMRMITIEGRSLGVIYVATPVLTTHTWQATIAASIGMFITAFIVVTAWVLLEIEKRQFSSVLHEEHVQEMEGTIDQLETTKNRMVAQENLASLGGLTAGIAHEIKNPLNFINNFSTLSLELIDQIENFIGKYKHLGTTEEFDDMTSSIETLKSNINTIHDQGKRADSTIQRMLAHSRGKPGEWMMTDVHKLLEEYINFSYHGMRAKNSSFNVKIEKEFDDTVKQIEVVSNDISRVFLNLLNNAFQSVDEKKRKLGESYANPTVSIKTQNVGNYLRIRVRDNGLGISEENRSKIFTPFFTTKPTGLGTGLGLSLSYNIIVREHRGSLTFETQENEYCEFIITIPLQPKKEKEVVLDENHGH